MQKLCRLIFISAFICLDSPLFAQIINLDSYVTTGELTLFQSMADPNGYYYCPNHIQLAVHEDGTPKLSFLRYVENIHSGANLSEQSEGEGGGIVHAVVSLAISPEQLQDAQQDLRRKTKNGTILGPVMYESGTVSLISSFKDENGELTKQVIGLGKAPVLEGQQTAVSLHLTKKGAKILWESFKTPTPDMTFSFEMVLSGYRSPKRALIEADFDKIYTHHGFDAGFAMPYLGAEIKLTFDKLREQGAIKVTSYGDDDKMEDLIATAYNKLTQLMFDPISSSDLSGSNMASALGGGGSMLDRATKMLKDNREVAQAENKRIQEDNSSRKKQQQAETSTSPSDEGTSLLRSGAGKMAADSALYDEIQGRKPESNNKTQSGRPQPYAESSPSQPGERLQNAKPSTQSVQESEDRKEVPLPKFAAAVAYEMKRIKHSGKFKIDLNKHTVDRQVLPFSENIGQINCAECFRQVNLDDPLFRQREIVAFIDGLNARDFDKYINFVSLVLEKKHNSTDVTQDEVRIDRNNFSTEGNNFKLLYGWKNDADRRQWLEYRYKTHWSFFGGQTIESEWSQTTSQALDLVPPFQRRIVDLEADPELIRAAGVRSIMVNIYYNTGNSEQMKQITLNTGKNEYSARMEFLLPQGTYEYEYEVTWRLWQATTKSVRQKTNEDILFVDNIGSY